MPQSMRVFFSYPHSDRAFATRLAKSLSQQGLELNGIDPSTPAARNGIEQLEKQILSAGAVLLLINPRSKFDESQQRIWQAILGAAWENRKLRILPVLLRDAELPPFVRSAAAGNNVQAIRIHDPNDLGSITRAILGNLEFKRAYPAPATRSVRSFSPHDISFDEPLTGAGGSNGKTLGSASAGEVSFDSPDDQSVSSDKTSVTFEIYPSSPEADRKERLERLAEMREYVEQLKH